jgi:hypothetical protein
MAEIITLSGKRIEPEKELELSTTLVEFVSRLPEDPVIKTGHKAVIIVEDKETEETTIYQFNCSNMEMLWLSKLIEQSAMYEDYDEYED